MTPEDFLGIVTHTILDGRQRYIALCAAAPQQIPAKDELLQIVNGTVETIVHAASEVSSAERAEALTKATAIIVNLSFARIGSVLETQFHTVDREGRRKGDRSSSAPSRCPGASIWRPGDISYGKSEHRTQDWNCEAARRLRIARRKSPTMYRLTLIVQVLFLACSLYTLSRLIPDLLR
jgi:hypothetical protein